MKKIICLLFSILISLCCCSCENSPKQEKIHLTKTDYQYIDSVYNSMYKWDNTYYDSGKQNKIDKISFYDFDGTNNIVFYTNYPVAGYCGSGYYVNSKGIKEIKLTIYDHDERIRHEGWLARNVIEGTNWNDDATKKEKYKKIKKAYKKFLKDNIYKN